MTARSELAPNAAEKRTAAKARRGAAAIRRQRCLEALTAGWTVEQIAEMLKISVRTVRREVDRALDDRRVDAPWNATSICRFSG